MSGRVQGVFFRDSCRRVAEEHGVAGSAANLLDGRVEVILEGLPEAVERVISWCRKGPRHASVSGVEIVDEKPTGASRFTVG